MGKAFGGKRRSSGNVAGRYLAAIGAGGCGEMEMEDPTLSPVKGPLAACGSREQTNGLGLDMQQQRPSEKAPKTPTRKEQRRVSAAVLEGQSSNRMHNPQASPQQQQQQQQQLKVQSSPSGITATTTDACSWATSAASPSSRKGRATPSRSPINLNANTRQEASTSFFSVFPSAKLTLPAAKIALRSSASKRPPQTQAQNEATREGSSSSSALQPSRNRPQHMQANSSQPIHHTPTSQSKQPITPRQNQQHRPYHHGTASHQASPAYTTSEVLSDVLASEGAPTEIMTNRTIDRRYMMDPEDALIWSSKKQRHSGYYDQDDDDLAEEKKQDSDHSTTTSPRSTHHHQPRGRQVQGESNNAPHDETTMDEDLMLYGAVPLERSNTRRTSNRGKFSQPNPSVNAYPASFAQSPYGQHVLHSRTRPHQSPQASPSQQHYHNYHPSSPQQSPPYQPQQPRTSPRLNKLLNGDNSGQEGYVRRKGKDETPLDTKSLLSTSTNNTSSSDVSPTNNMLNPILHKVKANTVTPQPKEQTNPSTPQPKEQTKPKIGHWWSSDRFKLKPRVSPQQQQSKEEQQRQSQPSPKANKAVVAYPDSPLSYLKPEKGKPDSEASEAQKKPAPKSPQDQKKDSSPTKAEITIVEKGVPTNKNEVHESFVGNKSDAGTIGVFDDSDEDQFGPKPAPPVPKLPPCKSDPQKRKHTAGQRKGLTKQQPEKPSGQPPKVNLKPRKNRVSKEVFEERSIGSSSSGWTPVALSEDGLNFSPENDAPLLPLFSQDRFDLFGENRNRADPPISSTTKTTKLEDKLNSGQTPVSGRQHQQRPQNPREHRMQGQTSARGTKPVPAVTMEEQRSKQQGSRPCPSPEIWRRGGDDGAAGLASPDPIFCTQPSASQTVASSTNLSEDAFQKQQETQSPPATQQHETHESKTFSQPHQRHGLPTPPKRWPKVKSHFDENFFKKKGPSAFENQKHSSFNIHYGKSQGTPKRSVSGPSMGFARWGQAKDFPEEMDDSSRQVETGAADTDTDKSITSTGSMPRRAKSEQLGGNTKKKVGSPLRGSSPLSGSFRAAFAAFEKAHAGREAQALFPDGQLFVDDRNESGDGLETKSSFVSSRLAMVLHTHLSMEETVEHHADTGSVDVQSIRSNFEGVAALDDDADDDDDTASVKSLRENFERTAVDPPDTAVSKMRAFFEATKAPIAKDFETGNLELKEAWNKFETTTGPRQKRQFARKDREGRPPTALGRPSVPPSVSVVARARKFGPKETVSGGLVVQERTYSYEQHEFVETRNVDLTTKQDAAGSLPLSSSDSGVRSSIEGDDVALKDLMMQNEIAWKAYGTDSSRRTPNETGNKTIKIPIDGDPSLEVSGYSAEMSIPSDRQVLPTETGDGDLVARGEQEGLQRPGPTNSNASSDEIVSPPRLGIQSNPRYEDRFARNSYLPKDFTPTAKTNDVRSRQFTDKDTMSASEGEFSDGVTLDLSIADVSQLTDPTVIQSKYGDESTVGDVSTGEETLEIDLLDCEAKRSEASSSQQTEAAAPLMARALKRLSDDLSLESRNQIVKLWEKSGLLANYRLSKSSTGGEESKSPDIEDSNGWDLRCVETSFPSKGFSSSDKFFGFDGEPAQEWQSFDKGSVWPEDPFSSQGMPTNEDKMSRVGPSSGQARDPDGFRIDSQMNASVHIAEAQADKTENTETTGSGSTTQESKGGPTEKMFPILPTKDDASDKPKSPPRMYDVRSRVYTQAKQHAKSRLAARSSPKTAAKGSQIVEKPSSSPPNRSPTLGNPPTTSRSTTPPASRPATPTSRPATPVLHYKTSPPHPVTPPSRSPRTPTSLPATPTISRTSSSTRAVTPTINNLRGGGDESRITPKVSHRRGDVQAHLLQPSSSLLDAFPNQWKPQSSYAMPSPRLGEFNQEGSSFPSRAKHDENFFPSNELPSATFEATLFDEPSPVFESSPLFKPGPDNNNFPATSQRSSQAPSNDTTGRPHQTGMFSRTHPTSHDSIRQRKQTATANVQAFRVTPPREQTYKYFVPDQKHQPSPKPSPGGRLAAVVGKHAALMARLKVLKAARMSRSAAISPQRGHREEQASSTGTANTAANNRPKTSIGRAIASVYKSRRGAGYHNPQDSIASPSTMDRVVFKAERQQAPETDESAFDPFFSVEDSDDLSDSTWSSTHFGGRAFAAALEVE